MIWWFLILVELMQEALHCVLKEILNKALNQVLRQMLSSDVLEVKVHALL